MPSPALLRALLEQPIAGRRAPGGRAWPPSQLRAGLGPRVRIPREPLPQHQFLRLRAAAPEAAERKPGKESEPLAGGRSQGGDSKDAEEDRDEEGASASLMKPWPSSSRFTNPLVGRGDWVSLRKYAS
nr:large ribosomal subunit protein eL30 isoform X2 [Delphinus delphis]